MTPAQLRDLIPRVENGRGPDPELGNKVLLAVGGDRTWAGNFYGPPHQWTTPWGGAFGKDDFRLLNPLGSLDAAVALQEKLLPGWTWTASKRDSECPYDDGMDGVSLTGPYNNEDPPVREAVDSKACSVCRAFVAATLRAKLAELEG